MDLRELHLRLTRGDAAAQSEFWRSHLPIARRVCRGVLGPGAEADEVADGALIDFIFDHAQRLEQPEAMTAYLRLICARRAARVRKRKRELAIEATPPPIEGAAIEENAERALMMSRLTECLHVLTPKARLVLRLRYRGDLNIESIGEIAGGTKQYISKLLQQTHAKLRECLSSKRRERLLRQELGQHG